MRPLRLGSSRSTKQAVPGLAISKKVLRLLSLRSACSASAILSGSSLLLPFGRDRESGGIDTDCPASFSEGLARPPHIDCVELGQ